MDWGDGSKRHHTGCCDDDQAGRQAERRDAPRRQSLRRQVVDTVVERPGIGC